MLIGLIIGWVGEGFVVVLLELVIGKLFFSLVISSIIFVVLGFILVMYIDVVIGELFFKSYSIVNMEKVVLFVVKLFYYFYKVMFFFIWVLNYLVVGLGKFLGVCFVFEGEEILF